MAIQNKTTLKTFFQTGDIPTESQYADFIDSTVTLSGDNTGEVSILGNITASGNLSASGDLIINDITASGNISASGNLDITGNVDIDGNLDVDGTTNLDVVDIDGAVDMASTLNITSHITASGDISSSGDIHTSALIVDEKTAIDTGVSNTLGQLFADPTIVGIDIGRAGSETKNIRLLGPVTASGNISASGNVYANTHHVKGELALDTDGSTQGRVFSGQTITGIQVGRQGSTNRNIELLGPVTASGNISASGNFIGLTGSFGKLETSNIKLGGTEITSTAAEINFLDGVISNVKEAYDTVSYNGTTGVLTFTELDNGTDTVDLGVGTADKPTFAGLTINKDDVGAAGEYGGTLTAIGQSVKFTISNIPTIPGRASNKVSKPSPTFIRNNVVNSDSVILITCTTAELSAVGFGNDTVTAIENSGFFLNIGNESGADFTATSASFSAIIL